MCASIHIHVWNKVHVYVYCNFRYYSFECIWEKKKKLEVAVIKCSLAVLFRLYIFSSFSHANRNTKTRYACVSTRAVCLCYIINECTNRCGVYHYSARRVCKTKLLIFIERRRYRQKKAHRHNKFKFQTSPSLLDYFATLINPRAYLRKFI